jgi:hypothetical protein
MLKCIEGALEDMVDRLRPVLIELMTMEKESEKWPEIKTQITDTKKNLAHTISFIETHEIQEEGGD